VSTSDFVSVAAAKSGADLRARARLGAALDPEPYATSVAGAVKLCGGAIGRSTIYLALKSGSLPSRKAGARRVILVADLQEWLHDLPSPPPHRGT
jgi:hypothetical protein